MLTFGKSDVNASREEVIVISIESESPTGEDKIEDDGVDGKLTWRVIDNLAAVEIFCAGGAELVPTKVSTSIAGGDSRAGVENMGASIFLMFVLNLKRRAQDRNRLRPFNSLQGRKKTRENEKLSHNKCVHEKQ